MKRKPLWEQHVPIERYIPLMESARFDVPKMTHQPKRRVWRVARNLVLLQPILHPGQTLSGLIVPNRYDKPAVHFRVVGIGPGAIVKEGRKKRFVRPEVMPGDIVLSRHWVEGHGERLPQPVHIDRQDGKGLVFVDCRYIIAKVEFPMSSKFDL